MKLDHPHLTLARTLWSAAADGDAEALGLLFDEDVCWRTIGLNPLSGEYRGPEEVLDFLAQVGEASDEFSSQLGSVYVNDEGAVVLYHVSARRGSKTLEMDYLLHLRVRNSLIVEALTVPVDQRTNDQFWS
jgi:ketosteroid isomerase-like protein